MNEFYTDFADYMGRYFPGTKIQKISVNSGAGCPNRDGSIGRGGCIYCNNTSFTPAYCFSTDGIRTQIEKGKAFFSRKYPEMKYLAYFQSYTSTYRKDVRELERLYREALECEGVVGIIIGTRPDCLSDEVVEMLATLNRKHPIFVELGVETLKDSTLRLINRGHDSATSREAIIKLAEAGLHVGVHLIAGLPGETLDDAKQTVREISGLPVESIKLHHLQVLRGTPLHRMINEGTLSVHPLDMEEYLDFCMDVVGMVPPEIAIERFLASAPPDMVVAPKWGVKNYEFTNKLLNKLRNR